MLSVQFRFQLRCKAQKRLCLRSCANSGQFSLLPATTAARAAYDLGLPTQDNHLIKYCLDLIGDNPDQPVNQLMFPASPIYDAKDMLGAPGRWMYSSLIDALIDRHTYSTYFSGTASLFYANRLGEPGYNSARAMKISSLVQERNGLN